MNFQEWNLDDDRFGMPTAQKPRTAEGGSGAGIPIRSVTEDVPLWYSHLAIQFIIALGIPFFLFTATLLYNSRYLPEIIVACIPIGFVIGVYKYISNLDTYQSNKGTKLIAALVGHDV